MSTNLIQDWNNFCSGRSDVDAHYFDSLFMSERSHHELTEVFSHFPNSNALIANVEEFWRPSLELSESDRQARIVELTKADIAEKRAIIEVEGEDALMATIDDADYEFVDWPSFTTIFQENETVDMFIETIGDHVLYELLPNDRNTIALYSILYHLGGSLELRWSLISPLFKQGNYQFRAFFDLWKIGGHYAVTENGILLTSAPVNQTKAT